MARQPPAVQRRRDGPWDEWTEVDSTETSTACCLVWQPAEGTIGDVAFAVPVAAGVQCGIATARGTPSPAGRVLGRIGTGTVDPGPAAWQQALGGITVTGADFSTVVQAIRDALPPPSEAAAASGLAGASAAAALRLRCLLAGQRPAGPAWVPELPGGLPAGFQPTSWQPGAPEPEAIRAARAPRLVDEGGLLPWTEPAWRWLCSQPLLVRRRIRVQAEQSAQAVGAAWVDLSTARQRPRR